MLIVCPNCSTSYDIGAANLGAEGRQVRCARCRTQWVAREEPRVVLPALELAGAEGDTPRSFGLAHTPARLPAPRAQDEPPPEAGDAVQAAQTVSPAEIAIIAAAEAPPLAPSEGTIVEAIAHGESSGVPADEQPGAQEDIESVAMRRARIARDVRRKRPRRRPALALAIMASIGAFAALVAWRAEVVRLAPQTARLYEAVGLTVNLRGLAFEDVRIAEETQDGVPVLVVQGMIANIVNRPVDVPRLRFALRSSAGVETYAWTAQPPQPSLGAGERIPFRSRLASPPPDTKDVMVRFFQRRDLVAGH